MKTLNSITKLWDIKPFRDKQKKLRKLYLLSGDRSLFIAFKAKVLILEDYFAKIDANAKHLKDILI